MINKKVITLGWAGEKNHLAKEARNNRFLNPLLEKTFKNPISERII